MWMDQESILLNEVSQRERDKQNDLYHMQDKKIAEINKCPKATSEKATILLVEGKITLQEKRRQAGTRLGGKLMTFAEGSGHL